MNRLIGLLIVALCSFMLGRNTANEPLPNPFPQPDGEQFVAEWVLWIEEIEDRTKYPEQTQAMQSSEMDSLIAEIGLKKRVYDDDQSEASAFLSIAGDTRPAMIVLGKDPSQYKVFPAPSSVEEAETLIRGAIVR